MISIEELPEPTFRSESESLAAGRSVAQKLGIVRAEIAADGASAEILALIDRAIFEIHHWSKYSNGEIDRIVLSLIEEGLNCTSDISQELGIDRRIVVDSLNRLEARRRVYKVARLVPGSDRPQFMYKSKRIANLEANEAMCQVVGNWPQVEDPIVAF